MKDVNAELAAKGCKTYCDSGLRNQSKTKVVPHLPWSSRYDSARPGTFPGRALNSQ